MGLRELMGLLEHIQGSAGIIVALKGYMGGKAIFYLLEGTIMTTCARCRKFHPLLKQIVLAAESAWNDPCER